MKPIKGEPYKLTSGRPNGGFISTVCLGETFNLYHFRTADPLYPIRTMVVVKSRFASRYISGRLAPPDPK